ncbi:MAG: PilZ domain-containing protein [Mariprofundaceae bacterium]|nr:PilZ domain-containing protein [Mariprofundaceae bacterium]
MSAQHNLAADTTHLLIEALEKDLPEAGEENIRAIATVMQGGKSPVPLHRLAVSLLSSHPSVGTILTALLRCEWLSVQQLIERVNPGNARHQIEMFSACVECFNTLQSAIIHAADQGWQHAIDDERRSRVIAECRASWAESKRVQLHNFFDEIPVTASAPYISLKGEHLCIAVSPELAPVFSASSSMRDALISNPDRRYNLLVSVEKRHGPELLLSIDGIEPALRERRRDIRVQLDKPLPFAAEKRGQRLHGKIVNLSSTGLGLLMPAQTSISVGETLKCAWKFPESNILLQGTACWMQNDTSGVHVGVHFEADHVQKERIYKYLFVKQQAIIGRLRRLDMPGWMHADVE